MIFSIPHAGLVHMPLALAFLIPLMYALAWLSERKNWLGSNVWLAVVLFTLIQIGSIFLGIHSGEAAEFTSSASPEAIAHHEELAERFLGLWIILGIMLIVYVWLRRTHRLTWPLQGALMLLFAIQIYYAFLVGHLGGELIPR